MGIQNKSTSKQHSKLKTMFPLAVVVLGVFITVVGGNIIDLSDVDQVRVAACSGSLVLTSPDQIKTVFPASAKSLHSPQNIAKLQISKAEVQGCGCFIISSLKNGRGKSRFISSEGTLTEADKGFVRTIKSFRSVPCTKEAKTPLIAISVGSAVVVLIKKKRKSSSSISEDIELEDIDKQLLNNN